MSQCPYGRNCSRPGVRTLGDPVFYMAILYVLVFGYSGTQYPHNGGIMYRAPRICINISFMSYYLQEVIINSIFRHTTYILSQYNRDN